MRFPILICAVLLTALPFTPGFAQTTVVTTTNTAPASWRSMPPAQADAARIAEAARFNALSAEQRAQLVPNGSTRVETWRMTRHDDIGNYQRRRGNSPANWRDDARDVSPSIEDNSSFARARANYNAVGATTTTRTTVQHDDWRDRRYND